MENSELKTKVDNLYSHSSSRVDSSRVGNKRQADNQLDRQDVAAENNSTNEIMSMWDDFCKQHVSILINFFFFRFEMCFPVI